jgi:hypothetical protein
VTISGAAVINGVLSLGAGQISFPAAQSASAGVNTLDDYEEGGFTPTLTCDTPGNLSTVYNIRGGTYTKVGRLVSFSFAISTTSWAHTTASGDIVITGLPFTIATAFRASCAVGNHTVNTAADLTVGAFVVGQTVKLTASDTSTGGTSYLTIGAMPSGSNQEISVSGCYEAAT